MADVTYSQVGLDVVGRMAKFITVDSINTSDTLTFDEFSTVLYFNAVLASDMTTEVSTTISGNVVTITSSSLSGASIVAMVTGSKAR
jgi:hypothetical protein